MKLDPKKFAAIKNVIIYSRVHHLEDGGDKYLEQQERICKEYAEKNGWNVADSVKEIACGMLDEWSRPVFQKAFNDAGKFPVRKNKCVVLVSSIDRLTKDVALCGMNERDIKFLSVQDKEGPDNLVMQMRLIMAQENWRQKYPHLHDNGCIKKEAFRNKQGWINYSKYWNILIDSSLARGMTPQQLIDERNMYRQWRDPEWDMEYFTNIQNLANSN